MWNRTHTISVIPDLRLTNTEISFCATELQSTVSFIPLKRICFSHIHAIRITNELFYFYIQLDKNLLSPSLSLSLSLSLSFIVCHKVSNSVIFFIDQSIIQLLLLLLLYTISYTISGKISKGTKGKIYSRSQKNWCKKMWKDRP